MPQSAPPSPNARPLCPSRPGAASGCCSVVCPHVAPSDQLASATTLPTVHPLRPLRACSAMDNRLPTGFLRSEQIVPELPPVPSTDDLPYSLAVTTPPTILLSTISRLAPPLKTPRFKRRPSTASSAKDKHDLLPPAPSPGDSSTSVHLSVVDGIVGNKVALSDSNEPRSATYEDSTLDEMNRKAHAAVAGLRAEASRLAGVGASPFVLLATCSVVDGSHAPRSPSVAVRLVS